MSIDWNHLLLVALDSLVARFAVVVAGVLFAQVIRRWWEKWKYGGWRVIILKGGKPLVDDAVSVEKAKQVRLMPEELPVFLKGKVSPYEWLNCDLGRPPVGCEILKVDSTKRRWTVDLDQNPPTSQVGARGGKQVEGMVKDTTASVG